jgi:hypothetical protein
VQYFDKVTGIISWYALRITPGAAQPVLLSRLPVKSQLVHSENQLSGTTFAVSSSGQELAVTGYTAGRGLEVNVYSVATGQLVRTWTSDDPSLTLPTETYSFTGLLVFDGLSLTWVNDDRGLDVATMSGTGPATGSSIVSGDPRATGTIRELDVTGPSSGDLDKDGKIVWSVPTNGQRDNSSLVAACAGGMPNTQVSADGTTLACAAKVTDGAMETLEWVTFPLGAGPATAAQATIVHPVVTKTHPDEMEEGLLNWVSPDGDTLVGGPPVDVMSHGKLTGLRFPKAFFQETAYDGLVF